MADVSKVKLPNNSVYNLKDKTQTRSDHRHYESDIVPLAHKTYASNSYYATTGSDYNTSSWYFMSVKPDAWYKPWTVKFKVHTFCPNYASYESITYATISGRSNDIVYANWNERQNSAHSYINVYPLKEAGFNAGYGHAIGMCIIWGDNYTNSNYYRTFEIDYYSCENCTVTFLDSLVKWPDWSGGTTTNYGGLIATNAVSRGLQESGDQDSTGYIIRKIYSLIKAGPNKVFPYTFLMECADGRWESLVTSNSTGTNKSRNTHGFRLGKLFYMNAGNTYNENVVLDNYRLWNMYSDVLDHRYSFNTANNATDGTVANQPVYLVGSLGSDGLFYLDTKWWTQTLPTSADGKLYIYLGRAYDYYRMTFDIHNPIYHYVNGAVREFTQDAGTVNGFTVQTAVPSGAKFTDTLYPNAVKNITRSGTTFTATRYDDTTFTFTQQDNDTKNTAGSTDTSSKIFLIGATSQAANPQTYSHDTVYVDTNGHLYSNSKQVVNLSDSQALTNKTYNGYTLGAACAKGVDTTVTSGSSNLVTSGAVYTAIDNLPEPMVFKGSLGTGGTITTLPTNGSASIGDTYKVITAGTYAGQAAKVGDTFICDSKTSSANTWVLIPSGDEPSGTVTSITIKASSPIAIDSSAAITTSGERTISHANSGVTAGTYRSVTVNATGHVTAGTNPTTLSGYGITDAKIASGTITLGSNTITPLTASSTLDATKLSGTIPSGCYTDTKNTAGSTDTSSKIFLIGATSQAANPQTYSQDTAYVGTDGCLYSGGSKVLTSHQDISGKVNRSGDTMTGALNFANGTANKMGDDAQVGDHNRSGSFGIQGLNGPTTITLLKQGGTWGNTEGGSIQYNATTKSLDFLFT